MDSGWDLGTIISDIMDFWHRGASPSNTHDHWPWRAAPPLPTPYRDALHDPSASSDYHEPAHYHHFFNDIHPTDDAALYLSMVYADNVEQGQHLIDCPESLMSGPNAKHDYFDCSGDGMSSPSARLEDGASATGLDPMSAQSRAGWTAARVALLRRLREIEEREMKLWTSQRRMVRRMKEEMVMAVEMYMLLMGVLYLAVAAMAHLTCAQLWGPALLAAVITCGTVAHVSDKLAKVDGVRYEINDRSSTVDGLRKDITNVWKGEYAPPHVLLATYYEKKEINEDDEEEEGHVQSVLTERFPIPRRFLIIALLITFAFLLLLSCAQMLCSESCPCK